MAKSKYNWGLMLMMYLKANYTTNDLHYIFGPVPGHISKRFSQVEDKNGNTIDLRKQGKKSMQLSPKAFPAELNQKIREDENAEEIMNRINLYYKNVCLPLKAAEAMELKERGLSNAAISERFERLSESSVQRLVKTFSKGNTPQELKRKVASIRDKFEAQLPLKGTQSK